MAHGYSQNGGKYLGGSKERQKPKNGPGKNAQHGDGGHHSQKAKGNKKPKSVKFLGLF